MVASVEEQSLFVKMVHVSFAPHLIINNNIILHRSSTDVSAGSLDRMN